MEQKSIFECTVLLPLTSHDFVSDIMKEATKADFSIFKLQFTDKLDSTADADRFFSAIGLLPVESFQLEFIYDGKSDADCFTKIINLLKLYSIKHIIVHNDDIVKILMDNGFIVESVR